MVGIHPREERAAVRVPEPRRDGRNIHPGLDGDGGDGIAKIMMRDELDAKLSAGPTRVNTLLRPAIRACENRREYTIQQGVACQNCTFAA